MHDPSLVQNRCFLYHLIGNGTGEWRVPVGGMGAVTDALAAAARAAGAELVTDAEVTAIRGGQGDAEVDVAHGGERRTLRARFVLANVAPWVLAGLLGGEPRPGGEAGRGPAQGQLPAQPAAAAGLGRGPAGRVRRDPAPRRGLPGA